MSQAGTLPDSYEPEALSHELNPYFEELSRFQSSKELHLSSLYRRLRPEVERILNSLVLEEYASPPQRRSSRVRATAWNIERGIELGGIVRVLRSHPLIGQSDLFLLTELDYGMARTRNQNVPREIAQQVGLNYAFAPSYINLVKGSGLEARVQGENQEALHGNALFSRYPIRKVVSIPLANGKDKMKGKEKRLGSQTAVAALIEHPIGPLRAVSVHLDAHSTQKHRMRQMKQILDRLESFEPDLPVVIGGDWNTSTYNSRTAFYSIAGYARRVLMGVRNVLENHYPHPDRWFERHLFRLLESRGYNYRDLNHPGACTLHYDIEDLAANGRMADWIPNWCFWFITWALKKQGGQCSMKLDWFAGKKIRPCASRSPGVVSDVHNRQNPLSDHDPIILDFRLD